MHNHEGLQVAENSKNYHYATYTFIRWGRRRESVVENLWLTKSHKHAGLSISGTAAVLKTVHTKVCGSSSLSSGANMVVVVEMAYTLDCGSSI